MASDRISGVLMGVKDKMAPNHISGVFMSAKDKMAPNHISGVLMGVKDIQIKPNLKRFLMGSGVGRKKKEATMAKKPSWMMPAVSHGYHTCESYTSPATYGDSNSDFIVAQREQIEELELWFFGVFDARVGDRVTKYMQSHLFDKKPKESHIRGKSKETMRKAFLGARSKVREASEETNGVGSVSAMVMDGEKLVLANMGDYRAVVCKDGFAHQIGTKKKQSTKKIWSHRLFRAKTKTCKSSDLVVGVEGVDPGTEFVILASNGIWEVMKNQEAVNLIRSIENPQTASEYLAEEASNRMSRGSISCLVIRFD
ncbi:putative protein phosphatase 2C-like protein 44 [Pyrus communis]|uniref:putative protein phosphatase 2C-like protein 44 n=1 Tax=Pyrus communis TaxID=23211 RepID=UPI0035C23513